MSKTKAGERLPYLLAKLKAPRVLERLEQTATLAREQSWPYERFLETLLEAEVFARDASGARMRVRAAGFPALKTLEDFDWSAQPSAERPLVLHLAQLAWIEVGRLAFERQVADLVDDQQVVALEAAQLGFELVAVLCLLEPRDPFLRGREGDAVAALAGFQAERDREVRLAGAGRPEEADVAALLLFALVSRRYERGSIIVTSNRGFEHWGEILGDAMVAAALIDRLVHHATMITPQRQELPPPRARPRRRARHSGSVAPRLRLTGRYRFNPDQWCTFRLRKLVHFSTALDTS